MFGLADVLKAKWPDVYDALCAWIENGGGKKRHETEQNQEENKMTDFLIWNRVVLDCWTELSTDRTDPALKTGRKGSGGVQTFSHSKFILKFFWIIKCKQTTCKLSFLQMEHEKIQTHSYQFSAELDFNVYIV